MIFNCENGVIGFLSISDDSISIDWLNREDIKHSSMDSLCCKGLLSFQSGVESDTTTDEENLIGFSCSMDFRLTKLEHFFIAVDNFSSRSGSSNVD